MGMKLSGSGTKETEKTQSTTKSTPDVPGFIQEPSTQYYGAVGSALNGPTPQATPASPLQTAAFGRAMAGTRGAGGAIDATNNLLGFTPDNVQGVAGRDLSPYTNNYEQDVINGLLGDFAQGNGIALTQLRGSTPAGAYGGTRMKGAEDRLAGENLRTLATTLGGLRSDNFRNAQGLAQFDVGNDRANADRGLAGANFRLGAAGQAGSLGLANDANTRADTGLLSDLGAQERGITHENDPYQARIKQLTQIASLLGIRPDQFIGQTTNETGTGTRTKTDTPSLLDSIGKIMAIASAGKKLGS